MRDAFVSPLRDRSGRDAAKISDFPGPAQRVNDCACVHVRHHRTCAVRPQGTFALTKNACILFFSALKLSHRSTAHRASKLFTRPAQQQAPATTRSSKQDQLGATRKPMVAATSSQARTDLDHARMRARARLNPTRKYGRAVPINQPTRNTRLRQPGRCNRASPFSREGRASDSALARLKASIHKHGGGL